MIRILLTVFFTLIVFMPATAKSQPGRGHGFGLGHGIAEELNLSDEQIEQLTCDVPGQGRAVKEAFFAAKDKLNDLIRQRDVSDEEIFKQLETVNSLQADFNRHRLSKMLQVRKVLTAEQLEKLLQLRQSHNPLGEQGHGSGSGHGHRHGRNR